MAIAGLLLSELEQAIRRHMLSELPADPAASLRNEDFRSLHCIYATWRNRVPQAKARKVHLSDELLNNPERLTYGDGLSAVLREVANGADLRPRMSVAIDQAYALDPPRCLRRHHRAPQHDRLLANWGIHHLHLSTQRHHRRPDFVRRTAHVLLACFADKAAYLIDLRHHESDGANWSELAILEIIVRNWPAAGILQPARYVTGVVGGNWSDNDRRELQLAGVNDGAVEIDGRVWSVGGQTLGGSPNHVARHCMLTSWFLSGYSPTEAELRQTLASTASEHDLPADAWRAHVYRDEYGFINDGVFAPLGSLLP